MGISREELRKLNLVKVQGQLVERDALHIAEKIAEYDPNLYVQYLESTDRINDPPFRVMERCRDNVDRVAFTAWTLDDRLMQRIYAADTARTNPSENIFDVNERVRQEDRRRYRERMDDANDIAEHVLKSPKSRYTYKNPDTGKITTFE